MDGLVIIIVVGLDLYKDSLTKKMLNRKYIFAISSSVSLLHNFFKVLQKTLFFKHVTSHIENDG